MSKSWVTADGIDRCDSCQRAQIPVRLAVLKVTGVLADIYPEGRPGYYCQECIESGEYKGA